ncbi:MAG: GntR family transcriptional regulator [Streptosporangiaceae bacterium]
MADGSTPKYAQVVAEIRRRIERGTYPPGSLLPSEHQLVAEFGVSRPTIVRSLAALRQDGWIDTQQGKGSFVRGKPALADAERTRPAHGVLDVAEAQLAGELVQAGVRLAPPHITALLQLKPGARAFARQRLLTDGGEPVELVTAWLPLEVAAGTDLASADLLGESLRAHLAGLKKIRLDHAVEKITARLPQGEEAGLLRIGADTPLLSVIVTAYDASGQPVQVSDLVMPGQRHELQDAYPLA